MASLSILLYVFVTVLQTRCGPIAKDRNLKYCTDAYIAGLYKLLSNLFKKKMLTDLCPCFDFLVRSSRSAHILS